MQDEGRCDRRAESESGIRCGSVCVTVEALKINSSSNVLYVDFGVGSLLLLQLMIIFFVNELPIIN